MFLKEEELTKTENLIAGVEFKLLRTFPDDRGFFREVIRHNDPFFGNGPAENGFAQWSHSKMGLNTVKAWHYHHLQTDWWYVGIGVIHTVLIDNREESPTFKKKIEFKLGEKDLDPGALEAVVKIPTGVLHGCKVITEFAHLFYITNQTYNPKDEGRFAFNSKEIGHSWGDESVLVVAENDRRDFVPEASRLR